MPSRLKRSFLLGHADGCAAHGLKQAAEELRLQLPRREFHGWDGALRSEKRRNEKKAHLGIAADSHPTGVLTTPVEQLTEILRAIPVPQPSGVQAGKDPLDRGTLWSGPLSIDNGAALASAGGGGV